MPEYFVYIWCECSWTYICIITTEVLWKNYWCKLRLVELNIQLIILIVLVVKWWIDVSSDTISIITYLDIYNRTYTLAFSLSICHHYTICIIYSVSIRVPTLSINRSESKNLRGLRSTGSNTSRACPDIRVRRSCIFGIAGLRCIQYEILIFIYINNRERKDSL